MTFFSLSPIIFHDRMKLECSLQQIPHAVALGLLWLNCDWLKTPTSQKSFPGSGSQTLLSAETSDRQKYVRIRRLEGCRYYMKLPNTTDLSASTASQPFWGVTFWTVIFFLAYLAFTSGLKLKNWSNVSNTESTWKTVNREKGNDQCAGAWS